MCISFTIYYEYYHGLIVRTEAGKCCPLSYFSRQHFVCCNHQTMYRSMKASLALGSKNRALQYHGYKFNMFVLFAQVFIGYFPKCFNRHSNKSLKLFLQISEHHQKVTLLKKSHKYLLKTYIPTTLLLINGGSVNMCTCIII